MSDKPTLAMRVVGFLGALLIRMWMSTLRVRLLAEDPSVNPNAPECQRRYIYVLWHGSLLHPAYYFSKRRFYTIVSQSKDGEIATRIAEGLGWRVLRGSSSRGAIPAVRQALELDTHFAVTADGPRGPNQQCKMGVVFLASKTGAPLVPACVHYEKAWRAKSWDRFACPYPFSRVTIAGGRPIRVPPDADRETLERSLADVQREMDRMHRVAQGLEPIAEARTELRRSA